MKIQELKSKIKTEDFETVTLLVYEAIIDNKITQEQYTSLMYDIVEEFEGELDSDLDEDDFKESSDEDDLFFDNDDEFDENY
jgi:hypothetical protein